MSLFDRIFGNRPREKGKYQGGFKMLNGYVPHFSSYGGSIYESELIRAAINARATHISKLVVEMQGAARPSLQAKMKHAPNEWETYPSFLYKLSTQLDIFNTAFIVPVYDKYGEPSGIYAPLPETCELVQYSGVPYLRYKFRGENPAAIELEYCGVLTKFRYKDDLFGESNHALYPTLDLISIQNQGIKEGVKSAASYRFYASLSNFAKPDDIKKERQRFSKENFSAESNGGGMLLFPNTYNNITQIKSEPWVVSADEMNIIKSNVYEYFGVNQDVLENRAFGDAWSAFYEGAIEPVSIMLADTLTKMLFTLREQSQGNRVTVTSNRLQYMSNADKLAVSAQLLDRGIMSINDVRQIWNLAPVDGGDIRPIRGEYYDANVRLEGSSDE